MAKSKKSRFISFLLISIFMLSLLILGVFFWASKYIQSEPFIENIVSQIETIESVDIHHLERITLKSIYPDVKISIPKLSLTLSDDSTNFKLHLDDLTIRCDYDFMTSKGQAGYVRLAAVSARGVHKFPDTQADYDTLLSVYYEIVSDFMEFLENINTRITVENVKLLSINTDTSESANHTIENLFISKQDKAIRVDYTFDKADKEIQHQHELSDLQFKKESESIAAAYLFSEKAESSAKMIKIVSNLNFSRKSVSFSPLDIQIPNYSITGRISVVENEKLSVEGKIFLEGKLRDQSGVKTNSVLNTHSNQKLLNSAPLPFGFLTLFDANIEVIIPKMTYRGRNFFTGRLSITVADDQMKIQSKRSKFLQGAIKLSAHLSELSKVPQLEFKSRGYEHDLSVSGIEQGNKVVFHAGKFDLSLQMKLQGNSVAEMFSQSDGSIELAARDITINEYFEQILQLSGITIPFPLDSRETPSNQQINNKISPDDEGESLNTPADKLFTPCFSLQFYLADGYLVSEDGIILNTGQGLIIGSGIIDFHTEKLLFDARVQRNSPIDLNPFSVLKYTTLNGTLVNPEISLNRNNAIKKGLTTATALAFGFVPSIALMAIQEANAMKKKKLECRPQLFD